MSTFIIFIQLEDCAMSRDLNCLLLIIMTVYEKIESVNFSQVA